MSRGSMGLLLGMASTPALIFEPQRRISVTAFPHVSCAWCSLDGSRCGSPAPKKEAFLIS